MSFPLGAIRLINVALAMILQQLATGEIPQARELDEFQVEIDTTAEMLGQIGELVE